MKIRILIVFIVCLVFTAAFFISSPKANAFSLNDIVSNIKGIFSSPNQSQNPSLTITSKIALAPGGDYNQNGQITSGDIVRFSYIILNSTENSYKLVTLKTNIDSTLLNGVSNIQGAASLNNNNNTIVIPNINIDKDQVRKITFNAQINFNKDSDETISTQPELVDKDGKILVTDTKQSVAANKMNETTFNKFVHITK